MKVVFTTGQVAEICKVSRKTIVRRFNSGRLKGFRIPGGRRIIPRKCLINFLKKQGVPLGDLGDETKNKVLIVAQDQILIENFKREILLLDRSFKVEIAGSGFHAGLQIESFQPNCIIIDFSIGRTETLQICNSLRCNDKFADVIIIALLPDDGTSASFDRSSINKTFLKPLDAVLFAKIIHTLMGNKKQLV